MLRWHWLLPFRSKHFGGHSCVASKVHSPIAFISDTEGHGCPTWCPVQKPEPLSPSTNTSVAWLTGSRLIKCVLIAHGYQLNLLWVSIFLGYTMDGRYLMFIDIKEYHKHKRCKAFQNVNSCVHEVIDVNIHTFERAACGSALSLLMGGKGRGWGSERSQLYCVFAEYREPAPLTLFESQFMKAHLDVIVMLQGNYVCKHPAHSKWFSKTVTTKALGSNT